MAGKKFRKAKAPGAAGIYEELAAAILWLRGGAGGLAATPQAGRRALEKEIAELERKAFGLALRISLLRKLEARGLRRERRHGTGSLLKKP